MKLPFYGDVLDGFVQGMQDSMPPDIIVRGEAPQADVEYKKFHTDVIEEVRRGLGVADAQAELFMLDEVRERGALNWEWVQALLRAADVIPGVSAGAIEHITRDVFAYLSRSKIRSAVNEIVEADIPSSKAVVVGHSLGSVVAYDVLRNARRKDFEIPLYITVGSPLAVGPIRRTLAPIRFRRASAIGTTLWTSATWWPCTRSMPRPSQPTRRSRTIPRCATGPRMHTASQGTSTMRWLRSASMTLSREFEELCFGAATG